MMSDWWEHNAKYVKAWAAYLVMLLALRLAFAVVMKPLSALLGVFGLDDSHVQTVVGIALVITTYIVSFVVFRGAVRKFVLHRAE